MTALVSTRDVFGECLVELAKDNDKIVVLDADLAKATTTEKFAAAFPRRFFDVGIAEQNLVGTAAGLALAGLIPVASTFALFGTGRAYEQMRNSVAYPRLNVKLVCSHSGVTCGPDGGSHQSIEDLALMRGLPGMTVLSPADPVQAAWAIGTAIEIEGPVYVRLSRWKTKGVYQKGLDNFELGKAHVLRDGKDIALVSTGVLLGEALSAADKLAESGIDTAVIDMPTLKPFDTSFIANLGKRVRAIFTLEDHSIIGGLGSAVAEVLAENSVPCPLKRLGINDVFGCSGSAEELLHIFQLDSEGIVKQVESYMQVSRRSAV